MIKVIKTFIDRDTLKRFNPGDSYPSDNPERVEQLKERGYLKETAAKESTAKKTAQPKEAAAKSSAQPKRTTAKTTRSKKKE